MVRPYLPGCLRSPWRAIGISLLIALALLFLVPRVASAHAHLVQADPAPDSVIAHAPAVGEFVFDEPLNPTLTRVRVDDSNGRQVTSNTGRLASGHDGELWEAPLPRLSPGTYSVFWTSESATDGHVINSFYTFRIASSGGTNVIGAVTGSAAGTYGGPSSTGTAGGIDLPTGGALVTALIHWLTLVEQALWLACLLIEIIVLAPARRAGATPLAQLASAATGRVWYMTRATIVLTALALIGEILSLDLQGTNGNWLNALDPATIKGILSSQNGHVLVARLVVLVVAILVSALVNAPVLTAASQRRAALPMAPPTLGVVALGAPFVVPLRWESVRLPLTVLALFYMLLVAFSGHAADVTPAWLSLPIDWLHLVCTAAWAGGIAVLAWAVLPLRHALAPRDRVPAVLPLLDRFSPIAYGSIIALALSGLYNAVNHLDSPAQLTQTTYGQLLVVKSLLVGVLILLSASHVYWLRPRIARLQTESRPARGGNGAPGRADAAIAGVHEGLATLAARLRLEGGVGAAILLATALMSQTLPSATTTTATTPVATTPSSISGTASTGDLQVALTIAPPAVGSATFTLGMREGKTVLTSDTAAAIIHLYPAAQPDVRATLNATAQGTRFVAHGSLAATGAWRADVAVRTAQVPDYRTVPFTFTVGTGAAFVAPGLNPATATIQVAPGQLSSPNTFTLSGIHAVAVRVLSQSLDMNMGIVTYPATALSGERWKVINAFAPMNGRWGLTVQVQSQQGSPWTNLRQFVYQVPLSGSMQLLTPQAATAASTKVTASRPASLSSPFNVAWAEKLPYVALVTEMGSNGVRLLGKQILHTGVQAHGVDVLDGTPWAYVTNFGAVPGTVTQIDVRTMRVVHTFSVGLGPAHVIFTPDQQRAFVTDFRSSDLYAIDLKTGKTQRITFPNDDCFEPHGGDISEDGRTLYVACAGGAWIYTVNAVTLKPEKPVITAPGAYGVAVNAARHEVWVTNQTANDVTVLDEHTLRTLATIPVGKGPALLAPTPDGKRIYVADQLGNAVSVIDAASRKVIATLPVAAEPHGPDVTADGKYVYVPSIGGNVVTIIRTSDNRVAAVVPSAVGSNEVAIDKGVLPPTSSGH